MILIHQFDKWQQTFIWEAAVLLCLFASDVTS